VVSLIFRRDPPHLIGLKRIRTVIAPSLLMSPMIEVIEREVERERGDKERG
jgi:hypothetical protein